MPHTVVAEQALHLAREPARRAEARALLVVDGSQIGGRAADGPRLPRFRFGDQTGSRVGLLAAPGAVHALRRVDTVASPAG